MGFLAKMKANLALVPGWRTDRKIVVFESDDWGMIRTASPAAYQRLLKKGYPVDKCVYNSNDALETNEDLELLMEALKSVVDINGSPAKFTLNNIVANPDFEKIRKSNYTKYSYESFVETLKRYPKSDRVMDLYKNGIDNGVFQPQFHGREHVNVNRWMSALRSGDKTLKDAFDEEMFTVATDSSTSGRRDYLDSFGDAYEYEFESPDEIIITGAQLFKDIWGFSSESFIAPCYVWSSNIEPVLAAVGIKYIQGTHVQRVPKAGLELKIGRKYHYQGQRNKHGQRYLLRNVFFEPTENTQTDSVANALKQIELAFRLKKPAIISSHRLNYMGSLRPENRFNGLSQLKMLLSEIIKRYPDVEFMSSDQLGSLMTDQ